MAEPAKTEAEDSLQKSLASADATSRQLWKRSLQAKVKTFHVELVKQQLARQKVKEGLEQHSSAFPADKDEINALLKDVAAQTAANEKAQEQIQNVLDSLEDSTDGNDWKDEINALLKDVAAQTCANEKSQGQVQRVLHGLREAGAGTEKQKASELQKITASIDAVFHHFSGPSGVPAERLAEAMNILGMTHIEQQVKKRLEEAGSPTFLDHEAFHNFMQDELKQHLMARQEVEELPGSKVRSDVTAEDFQTLEVGPHDVKGSVDNSEGSLKCGEQVRYSLKDPVDFARFLREADVRLVRAKYLADLVLSKRPLPRRQEAASETFTTSDGQTETALVSHEEVDSWAKGDRHAIVCSISHAWETREHPDPCRYQLLHIVNHTGLFQAAFQADVWVFYDYVSLFQYERDPGHEQSSFGKSMENMHIMYSHECSLTCRIESLTPEDFWEAAKLNEEGLIPVFDAATKSVTAKPLKDLVENRTKYVERGWCKAEIEWSSLRTVNNQHQRIDQSDQSLEGHMPWWAYLASSMCNKCNLKGCWAFGAAEACRGADSEGQLEGLNGRIPMTSEKFRKQMEKAKFTHRSDAESVIHLQEKIFDEKVTMCQTLVLEGLPASEVTALAQSLPFYKNLKSLKMMKYDCSELEAKAFGKAVAETNIEKLEILWPLGKSGNFMAKAMAEALKSNNSIYRINLARTSIEAEAAKALADALRINTFLRDIDLSLNQIDSEGAKAFAEVLKVNNSIRNIDLSLNQIDSEGAKALAESMNVNNSVLKMDLSGNFIGLEGAKALEAVKEALERNRAVTFHSADEGHQEDLGDDQCSGREPFQMPMRIEAMADDLKSNKTVRALNLELQNVGPKGAKALAEALKVNSYIRIVDLNGNCMGPEGLEAIAVALKTNSSVQQIFLRRNNVLFQGAKALAEALKVNICIRKIDLSENEIGDGGAEAIAAALKINSTLESISFWNNNIGPEGAKALAEALKFNRAIRKVDLSDNDIGDGRQALKKVIAEKRETGVELQVGITMRVIL